MRCIHKVDHQVRANGSTFHGWHPCGRCMPCRVNRSREWQTRLLMESYSHLESVFVTLTYALDPVTVEKSQLQKFLKRLRKRMEPIAFRYFAVGEYGEVRSRPHYHLLLFGVGLDHEVMIQKSWPQGFVKIDELNAARCRYITKYTIKRMTQPGSYSDGRNPEFAIMSRKPSLGRKMLQSVMDSASGAGLSLDTGLSRDTSVKVQRTMLPGSIRLGGRIHRMDRNFSVLLSESLGSAPRNSLRKALGKQVKSWTEPLHPGYSFDQELESLQKAKSVMRKKGSL